MFLFLFMKMASNLVRAGIRMMCASAQVSLCAPRISLSIMLRKLTLMTTYLPTIYQALAESLVFNIVW